MGIPPCPGPWAPGRRAGRIAITLISGDGSGGFSVGQDAGTGSHSTVATGSSFTWCESRRICRTARLPNYGKRLDAQFTPDSTLSPDGAGKDQPVAGLSPTLRSFRGRYPHGSSGGQRYFVGGTVVAHGPAEICAYWSLRERKLPQWRPGEAVGGLSGTLRAVSFVRKTFNWSESPREAPVSDLLLAQTRPDHSRCCCNTQALRMRNALLKHPPAR